MSETRCTYGIPSRAEFYVVLVIGRDVAGGTETEAFDGYLCAEHVDDWHPEKILPAEMAEKGWRVLESEVHEINKEGSTA